MELEMAISILSKVIFMMVGFALICSLATICLLALSLGFIIASRWFAAKIKVAVSQSDYELLTKYKLKPFMFDDGSRTGSNVGP